MHDLSKAIGIALLLLVYLLVMLIVSPLHYVGTESFKYKMINRIKPIHERMRLLTKSIFEG